MIKYVFLGILFFLNNYLYASEIDENTKYVYKLCKRPLQPSNSVMRTLLTPILKALDFPCLEKEYLNPQHFHFFRVDKNNLTSQLAINNIYFDFNISDINQTKKIHEKRTLEYDNNSSFLDVSCGNNNFDNFGFFGNSKVKCDQNISDYPVCSLQTYDYDDLRSALEILLGDFANHEYELTSYNCQLFVNNVSDVYNKYQKLHSPICVPINYSNGPLLTRLFSCMRNSENKFIESMPWINTGIQWENSNEQMCRIR